MVLVKVMLIEFQIKWIIVIIAYMMFFSFIFNYILGNKIVLTNQELFIRTWKNGMFSRLSNPKAAGTSKRIEEIDFVFLGRLDYLHKLIAERYKDDKDTMLIELKTVRRIKMNIRKNFENGNRYQVPYSIVPFIVVFAKDGGKIVASAKPYSKKNLIKLFNDLNYLKVEAIIQKGIL